ncbi:enoyl-CoA hydratase/isomerase family protein [Paramicrobacterium chengjingii]|uniref:Enoyl-CoA hydratase/isomerase family protein n=1 Tax=Paramicrobacterium chengjingii TaxID=2769067 RepID=A0ABX6YKI4_9MICO|nr:enoyl-CoA hydratase/isomerase family protein [Microbacterium chengjingii]QPZ39339.1 enoyl-CoA hydratase/isomerase family protein [Microbacterium chengjingii]
MSYSEYGTLLVRAESRIAWVTIDNPPVNTLDAALAGDLRRFADEAASDDGLDVIVFQSANPEFFSAHADFEWSFDPGSLTALVDADADPALNPLQQLNERLRTLPQVTIAKLRGYARAGGAELAMAADMRFAAADRTWLSQPESLMGIFPGGGGTQYLNRLVGRARALEIVLGAELFDTTVAERYGWINRAMPDESLDAFVDALARRIAGLPKGVTAAAKEALDAAEASGFVPYLAEEAAAHAKVYPSPDDVVERLRVVMDHGGQTRDGELRLERLLESVPWAHRS